MCPRGVPCTGCWPSSDSLLNAAGRHHQCQPSCVCRTPVLLQSCTAEASWAALHGVGPAAAVHCVARVFRRFARPLLVLLLQLAFACCPTSSPACQPACHICYVLLSVLPPLKGLGCRRCPPHCPCAHAHIRLCRAASSADLDARQRPRGASHTLPRTTNTSLAFGLAAKSPTIHARWAPKQP